MSDAYTRADLASIDPGAWPDRGQRCGQCKVTVPEFADLDAANAARIKRLVVNGQSVLAMQELAALVGCSLRWAKIWVLHLGQAKPTFPGPPCPRCGKPIRTSAARQCPHCFADWHKPSEGGGT
jgi:hypothetical protein